LFIFVCQNNYGSLLLIVNEKELGVKLLERALEIDPLMENAMVNLGSHYQDEGLLSVADDLFKRAAAISPQARLLEIRMALQLSPVVSSWEQMSQERNKLWASTKALVSSGPPPDRLLTTLDSSLDRIHFYLVYAGLNDRFIQEEIAELYRLNIRNLSKICPDMDHHHHISSTNVRKGIVSPERDRSPLKTKKGPRIRIGFISKFFGVYEPHGMLLEGVMRYLPRSHFEVLALPVAISDKPLSPIIENSVDRVVFITLVHVNAFNQLCELNLDILVFADTLSEPMTHFLSHSRVATTQIAFWGNPVTSGSAYIDYFVSGDFMEHPFRTRIRKGSDAYTEQVVLLQGQGIWYSSPDSGEYKALEKKFNISTDRVFTREEFGFQEDWFIFFCPQSLFKIHPLFDRILGGILDKSPHAHLVITGGRKERWTDTFVQRLHKSLGSNKGRCHIIGRVSSEKFLQLLKISDVLLHPFPFDGSRTAADGIGMGIPFVTLPAEYLKGRMGASLIRTLDIPELVAKNMSDYIRIASELSCDRRFFASVKRKLQDRAGLIWEDMEYPFSWTEFLLVLSGDTPMNWNDFISASGRDADEETRLANIRSSNRASFDKHWAPETWLLSRSGEAMLPGVLDESSIPKIFNDWKSSVDSADEYGTPNTRTAASAEMDVISTIQNSALSGTSSNFQLHQGRYLF
jgi:protein O-GlcNAc transferase